MTVPVRTAVALLVALVFSPVATAVATGDSELLVTAERVECVYGSTTSASATSLAGTRIEVPPGGYTIERGSRQSSCLSTARLAAKAPGTARPPMAGGAQVSSISGRVKQAMLPSQGRIRYVPPKRYNPNDPLPQGDRGYLDRFGNEWTKGPSRTPGESFEWDVQLSSAGREQLGWLSRDGRHININRRGQVTHR